jgi:2-succinyl-6-hydroxy-2,4-cyclohexadiene-1-carboxylate synthase
MISLLLLHGFLGDRNDWCPVLPALESRGAVQAVELPGHGQSSVPATDAGLAAWCADLRGRCAPHTVVIGYSLGGRLALEAIARGLRPRALVLESASPGLRGEPERSARRTRDAEWAKRLRGGDWPGFLDDWYAQPVFASLRTRPDLLGALRSGRGGDPQALADALTTFSPGRLPWRGDRLAAVTCPVLALAGSLDPAYSAGLETLASLAPAVTTRRIAGAGHNLHRECPAAWLDAVTSFLETLT